MIERLPSKALAALEAPDLRALLAADGTPSGIAATAWAHDELDLEELSADDCFAVASWALEQFAESEEAGQLLEVCVAYRQPPSQRLHVGDAVLAFALDHALLRHLPGDDQRQDEEKPRGGRVLRYAVPDDCDGSDEDA